MLIVYNNDLCITLFIKNGFRKIKQLFKLYSINIIQI